MFILMVTVIITVYSLLNYYFLKKHSNFITLKSLPGILVLLVLVTIILTPVATVIFSQHGPTFMAAITGFTGYSWLAFLFLFLVIHGISDVVLFTTEKAGFSPPEYTARLVFFLTMVISIAILFYGRYEAKQIQIERIVVKTQKLPANDSKITIVQLSDIHFSPITGVKTAQMLHNLVQKEKPDIIVSTGDLLDRGIRRPNEVAAILRSMKAPMGKYAVTGNHEFFVGIEDSIKFTAESGFKTIRNDIVNVNNELSIMGVDDPTASRFGLKLKVNEKELMSRLNPSRFNLLLKHQPRIETTSLGKFDLQLSGHTHAGQIFPFTILVKLAFPYICGWYELEKHSRLYVSRGTGTWGPPFRFLASPEITVFELRNTM